MRCSPPSPPRDDAAVGAHVGRAERQHRGRRLLAAVRLDQLAEQPGGQKRVVAREHEHASPTRRAQRARSARRLRCRGAAPARLRVARRRHPRGRAPRRQRAGPARVSARLRSPSRRRGGRGADAGAWGRGSACAFPGRRPSRLLRAWRRSRLLNGWGARIRTWDHGTKTRCLTAWLRPIAAGRASLDDGSPP